MTDLYDPELNPLLDDPELDDDDPGPAEWAWLDGALEDQPE